VIIHNDCHPGNAIRTADGKVVLIDWEDAGWGPAVLDVGFLLISCDTESPWAPRLEADPACVVAVVDGYCRHHLPTRAELDRLVDAMRFQTTVYGAISFAESVTRPGEIDHEWWCARYHASDELAARARMQFEWHL
jgi:Ser/Thr protein kinase RdoA (MazF antagonist)